MPINYIFCDPSGGTYNQTPGSDPSGNPVYNSLIGGGCCNYIASGTNFSSIFSGLNNCLSGSCSSILGGSGNCDNVIKYAGIFGCNVKAVSGCAFHANNFVAQDLPSYSGSFHNLFQYILAPAILGFPLGTCIVVTS